MTELRIVWTRVVTEQYAQTVDLEDLPEEVQDAWTRGDDMRRNETLVSWLSDIEGEDEPDILDVGERAIVSVNALVWFVCGTCDWRTPAYASERIAEAAMVNHMQSTHADG